MNPTLELAPNGAVTGVNQDRLNDIPYFLTLNKPNTSVSVAANSSSDIISFSANADGPLLLTKLCGQFTGAALVHLKINDGKRKINMTSGGIHSSAIFGSGLKPYPLPQALYMDELRRVEAVITDLSGSTNTCRPLFQGSQARRMKVDASGALREARKLENRLSFPFIYSVDGGLISITALGTSQNSVTINKDFDFQLFQISGVKTGNYTIDIIDGNTGESIFNSRGDNHYEVADSLIVGTNFYPFRNFVPRTFRRGQKIIINTTDTSGADNSIYLAFSGRNVASDLGGLR